jgi:hypothetical protein
MNLAKLEIQKKDLFYIVLTVIILAAVFVLGYRQLNPAGGASAGVSVEVVQPVGASFNAAALDHIRDDKQSKNFVVPIDLGSGVGTTTPFGQL